MENMENKTVKKVNELENGYVQIVFEDNTFVIVKLVATSDSLTIELPSGEDEKPKKGKKDKKPKKGKKEEKEEEEEDEEEEEEEEDDDDDDDEESYTVEDIKEAEFEELVELIDDEELDIDVDGMTNTKKNTNKLANAIIKELGLK